MRKRYCTDDTLGCGYRLISQPFTECGYEGYCEFQRPRAYSIIENTHLKAGTLTSNVNKNKKGK